MNSKNTKIGAGLFLACLIVSGTIAYYVKHHQDDPTPSETEELLVQVTSSQPEEDNKIETESQENSVVDRQSENVPPVQETSKQEAKQNTVTLSVSHVSENDGTYSFTATYTGDVDEPCHYELWGKTLVKLSRDGVFENIPGTSSGTYKLILCGNNSKRKFAELKVKGFILDSTQQNSSDQPKAQPASPAQKKLISEDEFKARMLNLSDHSLDNTYPRKKKNVFLKDGFKIVTQGANEEDQINLPSDIQDIKDRIRMGNWKSVELIGLEYDEKGYVIVVKVKPVY